MKVEKLANVKMNWDTFTFPIKAYTPISLDGKEENNKKAIGLVIHQVDIRPYEPYLTIMTGGWIDLAEIEASYGTIVDDALINMSGIMFYAADGTPYPDLDLSETEIESITESSDEYPVYEDGDTVGVAIGKVEKYLADLKEDVDILYASGQGTEAVVDERDNKVYALSRRVNPDGFMVEEYTEVVVEG